MIQTNRWFIEKKFLEGGWADFAFNPESGYETKEQAENFLPLHQNHHFKYRHDFQSCRVPCQT